MRVREWVGLQKEMVQEISGILSLALLAINVSLSVFLLVRDQGGLVSNPAIVLPVVLTGMLLLVWTVAYTWHFIGKMHYAKQRALATLNPYMTTEFTPHEWVIWNNVSLPQMRAQRDLMEEMDLDTKEIEAAITCMEGWLAKGQIPKDEFPPAMARFLRAA